MYSPLYPKHTATVLAEEFGFEALTWVRTSILFAQSGDRIGAQVAALAARDLAAKAAHFASLALAVPS